MNVRLRDFVETEIGFFAVNTYEHPEDRVFAFLRYLNLNAVDNAINKYDLDKKDIRNNHIKITDTSKTYNILKDNFPEYLFYDKTKDIILHAVPKSEIIKIHTPQNRLKEIINNPLNKFETKCKNIAEILNKNGLDYKYMGVSGSTVIKLNNINSDIDFVIYGMENHKKAREILKSIFDEKLNKQNVKNNINIDASNNSNNNSNSNSNNCNNSNYGSDSNKYDIKPLSEEFWKKAYNKRIKDGTLSYEEFVWHEKRKYNRGAINGTMFDLLATRKWNEINMNYGDYIYKNMGFIEIEGTITNDKYMLDNPAIYNIENVKIVNLELNNKIMNEINPNSISEIASFTHTYAGQVFNGEKVIVRGKLENVSFKGENYNRIVVGTTREALNEYIKLQTY